MICCRHATAVVLGAVLAAAPAWAQDASDEAPSSEDQPEIRGGAYVIKGKLQKPEVTVLVRRKSLDAAVDLGLNRTFLNRVGDALEDEALAD